MQIYNTLPTKENSWWQIELFPAIGILREKVTEEDKKDAPQLRSYYAILFQWLFWSIEFFIYK